MRVFLTGATGFVGSAVAQELRRAGHQVLGLARNDAGAEALKRAGIGVHRGELTDTASLADGIRACDGVVHTAFIHDFSKYDENCEIDRRAITAMGDALAGSKRPLVVTSGTGMMAPGRLATEDAAPPPRPTISRVASEEAAAVVADRGVHVSVLRLPPSVHGEGDHGFVPLLIGIARQKGAAAFVGEGRNVWPAVHRLDAAVLYRLALEKGAARATYHGVAEEGVPFRDIAGVIGRRLGLPVASKTPAEALAHFGWFAHFAALDNPSSSASTREGLGWEPSRPGLIADLDQPHYFGG